MRGTVLCLLALFSCSAFAQSSANSPHSVRASAEATVTAKPDKAELSVSVVTHATTAQEAGSKNAEQTTQMLEAVKRALGNSGEVKTTGYAVGPDYQNSKNGRKPSGYQAANRILITINDLRLVGKIVDVATDSGANQITSVEFGLRNDQAVREQAFAEAAQKARGRAEAIAKALNLQVIGVLDASDQGAPQPRFPFLQTMSSSVSIQSGPTPIEVSTIDISATVMVMLEVR